MPGAPRIAVGTPQAYRGAFEGWFRSAGIRSELSAVDATGRPVWGIEVRTARQGGRRLAYLANLMREPLKVTLRWRANGARLVDWRTRKAIGRQVTLQPRQLVFGAY